MIEGVSLTPQKQIHVEGGNVMHGLKCSESSYKGFGEAYFSQIEHGCVKGWKRHNKVTLNIIVPVGAIKFVVYDNASFEEFVLGPQTNYSRLTIAPGLWMAFAGIAEGTSVLLDIISQEHDPMEADHLPIEAIPYKFI